MSKTAQRVAFVVGVIVTATVFIMAFRDKAPIPVCFMASMVIGAMSGGVALLAAYVFSNDRPNK